MRLVQRRTAGQIGQGARRNREGVGLQQQTVCLSRKQGNLLRRFLALDRLLQLGGGSCKFCMQRMRRQCRHLVLCTRRELLHFAVFEFADNRSVLDRAGVIDGDIIEQLPELADFRFR
ncbi:hypothetical protein [Massilia oculi]|uniref:hypothetical protein n=1 Tax=Massilia oculi TaxID=945844 RepID=UPI001E2BEB69|nr:hypothetical protein [Massilia oculi]